MDIKKVFLDLETTGTNYRLHSIHQISGLIEINGQVVDLFDFRVQPHPKALVEPEALALAGLDELDLLSYPPMKEVYVQFIKMLGKYIARYDSKDKAWLVGYNNRQFDDPFLRAWFEQNGDTYFGSWFWPDTIDVMVLASQYLIPKRRLMPSFKLKDVAGFLGIAVDPERLHEAGYDVELTKAIYDKITT